MSTNPSLSAEFTLICPVLHPSYFFAGAGLGDGYSGVGSGTGGGGVDGVGEVVWIGRGGGDSWDGVWTDAGVCTGLGFCADDDARGSPILDPSA